MSLTRKQRLLVAIWDGWKAGKQYKYQALGALSGMTSMGVLCYHLDRLEAQGVIVRDRYETERGHTVMAEGSLRPGPRFAGIDRATGRPLVVIGDELPERETRAPKYERKSVLFDMAAAVRRLS